MRVVEYRAKTAISKSGMAELDYALNPYSGCLHGCKYCYAVDFTRIADAAENWGEVVYVKTNLMDLLKAEIKGMKRGLLAFQLSQIRTSRLRQSTASAVLQLIFS